MEKKGKQQQVMKGGGDSTSPPSSTSITRMDDLFGPKSSSSTSTGLFGSVFGPSSTGNIGSGNPNFGKQYGDPKYDVSDNHRSRGYIGAAVSNKEKNPHSQNEAVDPCYFSSSIFYGGQQVYAPKSHTSPTHQLFKKDEGNDDDPNGNNSNCASRGNWWQGSLYY